MRLNKTGMRVITSIIVASFFITLIATASAADYYVATTGSDDTGDGSADNPWGTIQHAVDYVADGDTIIVRDGTYTENVDVLKSVTIRSDNGPAVTTVQASVPNRHVFTIDALYVNISGFTIRGSTGEGKAGVYLGSENGAIYNNSVTNNSYGIWLYASSYNEITCNWIHNNIYAGFYLSPWWGGDDYFGSTDNTIERNNVIENGHYNGTTGGWEWQFDNNQRDDVSAQDNWWGTVDEACINASIYDHYDNEYRGIVNFSHSSGPAPCAPIPESAPILLFGAGLLALAGYVLREKRL